MGGKGSKNKGGEGEDRQTASSSSSSSSSTQSLPRQPNSILLNVYEPVQSSILGGVYHSGIELYDTEYMFGSGTSSLTGITSHRPRQLSDPQWQFREALNLGPTALSREEVRLLINEFKQSGEWASNTYSLTGKSKSTTTTCNIFRHLHFLFFSAFARPNHVVDD